MIVSINGSVFGYDDAGSGLPVVFLHGFPHDRSLWAQQRTALAPRVRCIAPDLRGFGVSVTKGPYSMDQYADDIDGSPRIEDIVNTKDGHALKTSPCGYG